MTRLTNISLNGDRLAKIGLGESLISNITQARAVSTASQLAEAIAQKALANLEDPKKYPVVAGSAEAALVAYLKTLPSSLRAKMSDKAKEVINPEDQALSKKSTVVLEGGNDKTARYRRAHRNALENTPLFMITALYLTLMGTSATVAAALFYPYAAMRILHSLCYVKAIQPFRTVSFVIALLIQVGVLGLIGYGTFVA